MGLLEPLEEAMWLGTLLYALFVATWAMIWLIYLKLKDQIEYQLITSDGATMIMVHEGVPEFSIVVNDKLEARLAKGDTLEYYGKPK
jgi:hypothetical protein